MNKWISELKWLSNLTKFPPFQDRYPEDQLVCLAQTLSNMEFMGCVYPKETMDLVNELSFGVVNEVR